ncbi:hypothetical protein [Sorangium sp. So ce1000]|uniref:hypothetical protein n=1 Tax=Sorangium sp. So ce1000 TaxID=3133325 RepID=UPI003F5F8C66
MVGLVVSAAGGCAALAGLEGGYYVLGENGGGDACDDGTRNNEETDVDCGGSTCPQCDIAKACAAADDCASGFCADGVCCNAACDAACDACTAALKASGDEDGTCGPSKAESECGEATCSEGVQTSRGTCDGTSVACGPGEEKACEEFACDPEANACFTECTESPQCARCHECSANDGACTLAAPGTPGLGCDEDQVCDAEGECRPANGQACTESGECASGLCVDGVCCNAACDSACMACNIEGSEGTCSNVPLGSEDGSDCSEVNVCDGEGACKLAPGEDCSTNEQCASGRCIPSLFTCNQIQTP